MESQAFQSVVQEQGSLTLFLKKLSISMPEVNKEDNSNMTI